MPDYSKLKKSQLIELLEKKDSEINNLEDQISELEDDIQFNYTHNADIEGDLEVFNLLNELICLRKTIDLIPSREQEFNDKINYLLDEHEKS